MTPSTPHGPQPGQHARLLAANADRLLPWMAGFAACLLLTASLFSSLGSRPGPLRLLPQTVHSGERVLWQLDLFDAQGHSLLRSDLVGVANRPLVAHFRSGTITLGAASRPQLTLDALAAADGLDLKLDLSLPGLIREERRRVRLTPGSAKTLSLTTREGEPLYLALLALPASSPAFAPAFARYLAAAGYARRAPEA